MNKDELLKQVHSILANGKELEKIKVKFTNGQVFKFDFVKERIEEEDEEINEEKVEEINEDVNDNDDTGDDNEVEEEKNNCENIIVTSPSISHSILKTLFEIFKLYPFSSYWLKKYLRGKV